MADRMDIKAWRKSQSGKAYTVPIGSSWTDKNGVIRLKFDALPVPDDRGQVTAFLEDRSHASASSGASTAQPGKRSADIDDDIPF